MNSAGTDGAGLFSRQKYTREFAAWSSHPMPRCRAVRWLRGMPPRSEHPTSRGRHSPASVF